MRFYGLLCAFFVMVVALGGCASAPTEEKVGKVEDLYNEGMDLLERKKFLRALTVFEELERQHPYSGWATRAQMMSAYAQFRMERYDDAILTAEQFIRLHPGHKDLPYLYHLRALSYYHQISDVARDQGATERALEAFEEIVNRFPGSEYAVDAKLKITLCRDHLAGKEMMVGRYYLKRKFYLSAINRFRTVVEKYQTSSQTPEALYRLTEAYWALGVTDEAQAAAAVLGHNFPASKWYKNAYNLLEQHDLRPRKGGSWLNGVWEENS